jgi:hypothetical protein
MTKDDIIRMAREAEVKHGRDLLLKYGIVDTLVSFANLVAAAEREAIASMIEDAPPLVEFAQNDKGGCMICGFTPKLAAEAIRQRSQS